MRELLVGWGGADGVQQQKRQRRAQETIVPEAGVREARLWMLQIAFWGAGGRNSSGGSGKGEFVLEGDETKKNLLGGLANVLTSLRAHGFMRAVDCINHTRSINNYGWKWDPAYREQHLTISTTHSIHHTDGEEALLKMAEQCATGLLLHTTPGTKAGHVPVPMWFGTEHYRADLYSGSKISGRFAY